MFWSVLLCLLRLLKASNKARREIQTTLNYPNGYSKHLYVIKKMSLINTCFRFSYLSLPGSEALSASSKEVREMVDRLEVLLLQIIKIKCYPFMASRLVFVLT